MALVMGRQIVNVRKVNAMVATLATIAICTVAARADERCGSVLTGLSTTSISGSVVTSTTWNLQPARQHGFRVWFRSLVRWARFENPQ